jgi:hypothetical protein
MQNNKLTCARCGGPIQGFYSYEASTEETTCPTCTELYCWRTTTRVLKNTDYAVDVDNGKEG